jgi:hypothetical protein
MGGRAIGRAMRRITKTESNYFERELHEKNTWGMGACEGVGIEKKGKYGTLHEKIHWVRERARRGYWKEKYMGYRSVRGRGYRKENCMIFFGTKSREVINHSRDIFFVG